MIPKKNPSMIKNKNINKIEADGKITVLQFESEKFIASEDEKNSSPDNCLAISLATAVAAKKFL